MEQSRMKRVVLLFVVLFAALRFATPGEWIFAQPVAEMCSQEVVAEASVSAANDIRGVELALEANSLFAPPVSQPTVVPPERTLPSFRLSHATIFSGRALYASKWPNGFADDRCFAPVKVVSVNRAADYYVFRLNRILI